MKPKLFNELVRSVKEAKAIQRGELKPGRVFTVAVKGDVEKYIARRKRADKAFVKDFESGYKEFKAGVTQTAVRGVAATNLFFFPKPMSRQIKAGGH